MTDARLAVPYMLLRTSGRSLLFAALAILASCGGG